MNRLLRAALAALALWTSNALAAEKLRLLIVDGQNNHNWKATTPILQEFLSRTGRFDVSIATSPPQQITC